MLVSSLYVSEIDYYCLVIVSQLNSGYSISCGLLVSPVSLLVSSIVNSYIGKFFMEQQPVNMTNKGSYCNPLTPYIAC